MARIIVKQMEKPVICEDGANLLDQLLQGGAFVDNPCSGKGICGKCKVRILSGKTCELSDTEKNLLKDQEVQEGIRLACMTEVYGDVEVELLKKERRHEVLTRGYLPEFEWDSFD